MAIRKLLVANRGEIAVRVIRACRQMGVRTVAVYSPPDARSAHVAAADESVALRGAAPRESYLDAAQLLRAAALTGADAVHPGYGFLSEDAGFADAVRDAGLRFVGPPSDAIRAMGSKLGARATMAAAGVPVLPGGPVPDDVHGFAEQIGYPVLVKASAGGGGRGMRIVREPAALDQALAAARREAGVAFGDDTVFVERYVEDPRHVEVQILGDHHGALVHLFERECSIQRRHQKVIEETPAPGLRGDVLQELYAAAVTAGRAIGYASAGTVEFIVDRDDRFHFLEVNTRLQVEHTVTEAVTGLDLVQLQLRIADGQPLPDEVQKPTRRGHAIEARLCAEDPLEGFLPASGTLDRFELPDGVRVDAGYRTGDDVGIHYDSLLAKVIAWAPTRGEAIQRLEHALSRARIAGVTTNRDLLVAVLRHPEFGDGRADTHFLQRHPPAALIGSPDEGTIQVHALAAALAAQADRRGAAGVQAFAPSGFRNNRSQLQQRELGLGERRLRVGYALGRDARFEVDGVALEDVEILDAGPRGVDLSVAGVRRTYDVDAGETITVTSPLGATTFARVPRFADPTGELPSGSLVAPMPGTVVQVGAAVGDVVEEGAVLLVLEAMKMEHAVRAPAGGTVTALAVEAGQTVASGHVLAVVEAS